MQKIPDDTDRDSRAVIPPSRRPAAPRNRTAAAGREFLNALSDDLAALASRLRNSVAAAGRRIARAGPPLVAAASVGTSRLRAFAAASASASRVRAGRAASSLAPWGHASGKVLRRFGLGLALTGIAAALAVSAVILWALPGLPLERPINESDKPTLLLEAVNGEPLGRVGPLRVADAALQEFPPVLIQAVLSIEDRRFYRHLGVDPLGILRAAHRNVAVGGIAEGGSTITQQLVKQRYLGNERTYARKLREALMAVWLDAHLGKTEILTRYLNSIYLGAGAYGMAAASRLYFDKRPADLTLAEAAMLAGLIRAPSQFSPARHLEAAQARAATVLDAMVASGAIDAQAAAAAKAKPAAVKLSPQLAQSGSWFADWIGTRAGAVIGARTGSMRVRTTLDPDLQRLAQDTLERTLAAQGARLGVTQGALVAMRPDGAVVAMVGGRDYRASQFNRAVEANRQPGSAFKLFVYLAALRNGYSPQDTIDAGPLEVNGWEPDNYADAHYGRITLAEAFARSVNTAAVRLAMDVGLDQVIAAARDLGIDTPLQPVPSLALGAVGVSLVDLTGAFASVRADRMRVQPWGIAAVGAEGSDALWAPQRQMATAKSLQPYQRPLVDLLRLVVERGTGRGAALRGFAAGKTGTSQNYRDAWFVGFNEDLVVGVWLGNDDNSPMNRVVGGSLPASIWQQFMTAAAPLVARQGVAAAIAPPPTAPQPPYDSPPPRSDDRADRNPAIRNPATQVASSQPSPGTCDYQACASTYHSFRASDCSYQSYSGSRRFCDMGAPVSRPAGPAAQATTDARGSAPQCNLDACARTYSSFDPSDCTYQPYGGGTRQFCER
jgi:penicillin-binding protein 1A